MNKQNIKQIIEDNILLKKPKKNNFHTIDNNGSWIFDFRRGILQSDILEKFAIYFRDLYENLYPFQIGGIEAGGIPLISGIILEGQKRGKKTNGFFVRKERKEKGLGNKIEGFLDDNKIIIVDDVLNSGESLVRIKKGLDQINRKIFKIFLFVNFGTEKGKDTIFNLNVDMEYIFTLGDFGLVDTGRKSISDNPLIFPKLKKLFELNNQNLFLDVPKSSPILEKNNIYLGGEGGIFYSICNQTGNINWVVDICQTRGHKNILSSPIIVEDDIIFGAYDGNLYFLNKYNGKINYVFEKADFIGSNPCYDKKNNFVYVGLEYSGSQNKGSLIAIDYNNKKVVWEHYFNDYVHCSPAVHNGVVFCGGNDGKVIIVDGKTGTIIYEIEINEPVKGSFSFDKSGEKCFFGCHDNNFYCLDIKLGEFIWKIETDNIIYTKALIINNDIFFGSLDKFFYHVNIKGKLIKKIATSGKIFGEPIIYNKYVLFASNDGYIYIYDIKQKIIKFCIYHGEKINNKMIIEDDILYVFDFVGGVYKYFIGNFF